MSLEVLRADFDSTKREHEKRLTLVEAGLDAKISADHFYWVLGLLVTLQSAILGASFWLLNTQLNVINVQMLDISKTATSVQVDVSTLKGKLSPYEVKFEK